MIRKKQLLEELEELRAKVIQLESPQKIKEEIKLIRFEYDGSILNTGQSVFPINKDTFKYLEMGKLLELKLHYNNIDGNEMILTITYKHTETRNKAYEILYKMLNEVWNIKEETNK